MEISRPGYIEKSHCGYCGGEDTSYIYGFSAANLTTSQYQTLLDRGFRRSGTFVYKPDMASSCCPQYTIRLDAERFSASKEQRKCINRFSKMALSRQDPAFHKGKNNVFDLDKAVELAESTGSRLKVVLDSNQCTDEKFELYKTYQMTIHKDEDGSRSGFIRFLCTDPFEDHPRYGARHQLYYLDDKLVAFGVVDILPLCVSSVYFVWDPQYAASGLGKLGALREIALTRQLQLPYYYLGFYIHSCQKMRYKGKYSPSFLLDPEFCLDEQHECWVPLPEYRSKLDNDKFYSFISADSQLAQSRLASGRPLDMPGTLTRCQLDRNTQIADTVTICLGQKTRIPAGLIESVLIPQSVETVAKILLELRSILGDHLFENLILRP